MRSTNKLTSSQVKAARPGDPDPSGKIRDPSKPYKLSDGGGLYLLVNPDGSRYWRMNYRHGGKQKTAVFGVFPDVSLYDARRARDAFDPAPPASSVTLAVCFEEFMRVRKSDLSIKHQLLMQSRCQPVLDQIGILFVGELRPSDFLPALRTIEDRTQTVAKKVRTDFGQMYDYAIACGYSDRNPVRDLRHALKPVKTGHRPAIIDPEGVCKLLRFFDSHPGMGIIVRHYHLLAPHLFVRPSELRLARWDQFSLESNTPTWSFTMSKMDGQQNADLIVPLSFQVVDLLRSLRKFTGHMPFLFSSLPDEKPISDAAAGMVLNRGGYKDRHCVHGWRATARTILAERLGYRDMQFLIELQLGHLVKDPLGGAYNRTQFIEDRREMMQVWSNYLTALVRKV